MRFGESAAALSPDGRWLAYASSESGDAEVYVQAFPDGGRKTQVSIGGGTDPLWSRSGQKIVYRNQNDGDKFMVASVTTQPAFTPGKPQLLFDVAAHGRIFGHYYDVSPDGERLTLVTFEPEEFPTKLIVVENWTEELKARVPTK
jgi:serine/threonine-protein kinase